MLEALRARIQVGFNNYQNKYEHLQVLNVKFEKFIYN